MKFERPPSPQNEKEQGDAGGKTEFFKKVKFLKNAALVGALILGGMGMANKTEQGHDKQSADTTNKTRIEKSASEHEELIKDVVVVDKKHAVGGAFFGEKVLTEAEEKENKSYISNEYRVTVSSPRGEEEFRVDKAMYDSLTKGTRAKLYLDKNGNPIAITSNLEKK